MSRLDCTGYVCCKPCRPRFRRLVDHIYPADPSEGLVTNDMQKLTFYAISHPEKLDRIGEYLAYRLGRDIYRERIGYVKISIEAMDRLLTACHGSPSLNLFVESFLKMVQRLLETPTAELQLLATQSFVNFSNIEEDAPSYHRRYDFFISKFSAMCHNSNSDPPMKRSLRLAGIKGLRGVIRKTVSDDLQVNIWEHQHMEKIIPSLLYNMHDGTSQEDQVDSDNSEENPKLLADGCLREVTGKASYGNLRFVLTPLLKHFDSHQLWSPPAFAVHCFKAIMYSIQSQHSYVVIQKLMTHLDQHSEDPVAIRIGIATVLSEIVVIAANASIGPSLLEIFNSMLRHLRHSVDYQLSEECQSDELENEFQEILINTIGAFANNLPDYQKGEIMMFIIGKVPLNVKGKWSDQILQKVLARTLLKVATKYRTGHLATVLTASFLDPLLKLAIVEDVEVRLLVQEILHTLFDRHRNSQILENLRCCEDINQLGLTIEKSTGRADVMFMRKNGQRLFSALVKSALKENNQQENYDAILCTMALILVEIGNEDKETKMELFRLAFVFQNLAVDSKYLQPWQKAALHNLVAKFLNFASQIPLTPALLQHVMERIEARRAKIPYLNVTSRPTVRLNAQFIDRSNAQFIDRSSDPLNENSSDLPGDLPNEDLMDGSAPVLPDDDFVLSDELLFDREYVVEALRSAKYETSKLEAEPMKKLMDSLTGDKSFKSPEDLPSIAGGPSIDIDSITSSPLNSRAASRRNTMSQAEQPITVDLLRQIANQPVEKLHVDDAERARQILIYYKTTPYQEMIAKHKEQMVDLPAVFDRIMQKVKAEDEAILIEASNIQPNGENHENILMISPIRKPKTAHEIKFPELFVF